MLVLLLIGCGQLIIGAEATSWEHVITHSLDGALVVDAREGGTDRQAGGRGPGVCVCVCVCVCLGVGGGRKAK